MFIWLSKRCERYKQKKTTATAIIKYTWYFIVCKECFLFWIFPKGYINEISIYWTVIFTYICLKSFFFSLYFACNRDLFHVLYLPQRTSTWGFTDTIAISLKFSFVNLLEKGEAWCFGFWVSSKQTNKQKEIKTNFLDNNKRLEKKSKRRKNEKRVNCDNLLTREIHLDTK